MLSSAKIQPEVATTSSSIGIRQSSMNKIWWQTLDILHDMLCWSSSNVSNILSRRRRHHTSSDVLRTRNGSMTSPSPHRDEWRSWLHRETPLASQQQRLADADCDVTETPRRRHRCWWWCHLVETAEFRDRPAADSTRTSLWRQCSRLPQSGSSSGYKVLGPLAGVPGHSGVRKPFSFWRVCSGTIFWSEIRLVVALSPTSDVCLLSDNDSRRTLALVPPAVRSWTPYGGASRQRAGRVAWSFGIWDLGKSLESHHRTVLVSSGSVMALKSVNQYLSINTCQPISVK